MFESKETIDQNENKLIGSTSLPPIVDRFYGPLYQFAVRLTRSESDAADLVQQTFFTLIQHLHQIRDLSRIKCWLFTTLRRKFLMEVRHRANHPEVEFLPDVHGLQTEDPGQWSSLDALTVRRALLQVEESYRTALELFYVKNLSYREIGKALQIPIGTVMSRLSRGKVKLKSVLLRYIFMAMVEYRECGGQVSQKTDTCPSCGDVMPNEPLLKALLNDIYPSSTGGDSAIARCATHCNGRNMWNLKAH